MSPQTLLTGAGSPNSHLPQKVLDISRNLCTNKFVVTPGDGHARDVQESDAHTAILRGIRLPQNRVLRLHWELRLALTSSLAKPERGWISGACMGVKPNAHHTWGLCDNIRPSDGFSLRVTESSLEIWRALYAPSDAKFEFANLVTHPLKSPRTPVNQGFLGKYCREVRESHE